jgi:hypothetical protein
MRTFQLPPPAALGEFEEAASQQITPKAPEPQRVELEASVFDAPGGNLLPLPVAAASVLPYALVGTDEGSVTGQSGAKEALVLRPGVRRTFVVPPGTALYAAARRGADGFFGATQTVYLSVFAVPVEIENLPRSR